MFCPEGFHLIHELEAMASNIVEARFPYALPEIDEALDQSEQLAELNSLMIEWSKSCQYLHHRLIDSFLQNVKDIWICSAKGQVLKFSKIALLPVDLIAFDREEYFARRETEYDAINLHYWIVDVKKYQNHILNIKEALPDDNPNTKFQVFECDLTPFDGWGLCIKAEGFPSSEADLLKISGLFSVANKSNLKGRPPEKIELAIALLSQHFPKGTSNVTVKEVMRTINAYGLFSEKTLSRALPVFAERMKTK